MPAEEGVHANLKAIQEMDDASTRFARVLLEQLPRIERDVRHISAALDTRRTDLRREVASLQENISSANENDDVSWARQRLEEAQDELSSVNRRIRRVAETAREYTRHARKTEALATEHNVKARAFLGGALDDVRAYLSHQSDSEAGNVQSVAATRGGRPNDAPTLAESLNRLGLDSSRPVTAEDMQALLAELKEDSPCHVDDKAIIHGEKEGPLSDDNLKRWTQEFLDLVPPDIVSSLPSLMIETTPLVDRGTYDVGGHLRLSSTHIRDSWKARCILFHELTHWLHRERKADDPWVVSIRNHFLKRTEGEELVQIQGKPRPVWVKRDHWYDSYAGRIYGCPEEETHLGLELPTRHVELLTYTPEALADAWNNESTRETLIITLNGFYYL